MATGNSRTGSGRATKMSQWDAYDMLPPEVKKAVQEAMIVYCCVNIYKYNKKHSNAATIAYIKSGDRSEIKRGWIPARGRRAKVPSPCEVENVTPLYANW